jgi:hypothetical protein
LVRVLLAAVVRRCESAFARGESTLFDACGPHRPRKLRLDSRSASGESAQLQNEKRSSQSFRTASEPDKPTVRLERVETSRVRGFSLAQAARAHDCGALRQRIVAFDQSRLVPNALRCCRSKLGFSQKMNGRRSVLVGSWARGSALDLPRRGSRASATKFHGGPASPRTPQTPRN